MPARKLSNANKLYELLQDAHKKKVHGGIGVMWKELRPYYGISKEIIGTFAKICEECSLKQARMKKAIVVKPISSSNFNERCQCDLIDLQSRPDNDYKFILVYQDHLTKYCVLKPLKQKTAAAVAKKLVKIFALLGTPQILHCDNGKEFANAVIRELVRQGGGRMKHGKPRHSQSQGSMERLNRYVGDMLTMWLRDDKTTHWAQALPHIQAAKNRRFHSGIGRSPYEALFGRKMKMGIEKNDPEPTMVDRGYGENEEESDENEEPFITIDGNDWVQNVAERFVALEHEENDVVADSEPETELDQREKAMDEQREGARTFQCKQAEKMLEASRKRNTPIIAGSSVRLAIDDVDRSKIDPRNLIGVVLRVTEDNFYEVGIKSGRLKHLYARNQLEPCSSSFLNIEDVPDKTIDSLRTAVGLISQTGAQGMRHCSCTTGCQTKKCKCKSAGQLCNSRCHHSGPCQNKYND